MDKVRFIEHKGKQILLIDMSNCAENEVLSIIEQAKKIIMSRPEKSVLTLTDVTHARYNAAVVLAMQLFTKGNKPYVKAAAVLGINAIKKIIFSKIMESSERDLHAFSDVEKAKDWLAGF